MFIERFYEQNLWNVGPKVFCHTLLHILFSLQKHTPQISEKKRLPEAVNIAPKSLSFKFFNFLTKLSTKFKKIPTIFAPEKT